MLKTLKPTEKGKETIRVAVVGAGSIDGVVAEIDYLNGYICAMGRQHGVPTPINDAVMRMVKEIEKGEREITPENVKDSLFANL
jgi:hypothetical protein